MVIGEDPSKICNKTSDKKFAVPVTWITCPKAKDVTISRRRLLSILLITCFIVKTLKKSIETTPNREATTRGKISKAPNEITDKKISNDLFAISLFEISDVAHSIVRRSF